MLPFFHSGSFQGHDTSKFKVKRILSQSASHKPTITGDKHARYDTTHNTSFNGLRGDPAKHVPKVGDLKVHIVKS